MSLDVMILFAWLAILQHSQLCLPASTIETAGTACTYLHFQGTATDQTKILFCSCPQATRGLSFCSLSLHDPLFYSSPVLFYFPLLGFLNSAFFSFLMSLFRRMSASKLLACWVLILDKLCKMSSVSLIIQVIRLLWWSKLKGKLLIIRLQALVWLVDFQATTTLLSTDMDLTLLLIHWLFGLLLQPKSVLGADCIREGRAWYITATERRLYIRKIETFYLLWGRRARSMLPVALKPSLWNEEEMADPAQTLVAEVGVI